MLKPAQHALLQDIALLAVRLSLGAYLFFAGIRKAFSHGMDFGQSMTAWMEKYHASTPSFVPSFVATPWGYVIPWLEIALGVLLVLGLFFRVTTAALTLMMLSIAVAVMAESGTPLHHSVIITTVAFLLIFVGPGRFSGDALLRGRRRG